MKKSIQSLKTHKSEESSVIMWSNALIIGTFNNWILDNLCTVLHQRRDVIKLSKAVWTKSESLCYERGKLVTEVFHLDKITF